MALRPHPARPQDTTMLIEIVRHTPGWVWALLAALLALGAALLRERRVSKARLFVLPVVLLALGLYSTTSVHPPGLALLGWALAWLVGIALGQRMPSPAGAAWDADGRALRLPGSTLPLLLIVAVFTLRYAGNVALVMHPQWREAASVALPLAAAYGVIGGVLLGRVLALLPRRTATIAHDAHAADDRRV
jgi:hypothetical protein